MYINICLYTFYIIVKKTRINYFELLTKFQNETKFELDDY